MKSKKRNTPKPVVDNGGITYTPEDWQRITDLFPKIMGDIARATGVPIKPKEPKGGVMTKDKNDALISFINRMRTRLLVFRHTLDEQYHNAREKLERDKTKQYLDSLDQILAVDAGYTGVHIDVYDLLGYVAILIFLEDGILLDAAFYPATEDLTTERIITYLERNLPNHVKAISTAPTSYFENAKWEQWAKKYSRPRGFNSNIFGAKMDVTGWLFVHFDRIQRGEEVKQ